MLRLSTHILAMSSSATPVIIIIIVVIVSVNVILLALIYCCGECGKVVPARQEEAIPPLENGDYTLIELEKRPSFSWHGQEGRRERQARAVESLVHEPIQWGATLKGREIVRGHYCAWCARPIYHTMGYRIESEYYHVGCGLYGVLCTFLAERALLLEELLPHTLSLSVVGLIMRIFLGRLPKHNGRDMKALWY